MIDLKIGQRYKRIGIPVPFVVEVTRIISPSYAVVVVVHSLPGAVRVLDEIVYGYKILSSADFEYLENQDKP